MKQDNKKEEYILIGLAIIPVIWLSLLIAPFIDGGLLNVITHINDIFNTPFSISWVDKSISCLFVGLLIYLFVLAVVYSNKIIIVEMKNTVVPMGQCKSC